jgi:fibronectin-binding autotransporter adhesin
LIENDAALDGAGTAELQQSTAAPSGTFVFRLHQEAAAQSPTIEASEVGAFTISSGAGNGAMDQNLNGTFTSPNLTVTFNAPVSSGRGTGNVVDTSANFTLALVYYVVNNGELALLVTNAGAVGSGSAEVQTGSVSGGLSGTYVFGSRGDDTFLDGVAAVGQFTANSGSLSGTEDVMVDGNFSANVTFPSTCYTAGSAGGISGRVVLTNGSGAPCSGSTLQVFWMVSPSRAFFLDNSGATIEDGTADLQTGSSFSAADLKGQFVIVMDGLDRTPEQAGLPDQILARLGTLQFDGAGNLTLNELVNASDSSGGGQSPGVLTGTYTVASNGRVVASLNGNTLNLVMYALSGSQAYVLQGDAGIITSGSVELQ